MTISFVLSDHKKKNGKQTIRLRLYERSLQYKNTGFEISPSQWDGAKQKVKTNHTNHLAINKALNAMYERIEAVYSSAVANGATLDAKSLLQTAFASHDFYEIADEIVKAVPNYRTRKKYISAINKLKEFAPTLEIEQITPEFLKKYKATLKNRHNTVVNRLSTFRTIYNLSPVKLPVNPFDEFSVGSYKRANVEPLTADEISLIWNYEPEHKSYELAKDTFLFSFYAAGMRSSDVLTLKWSNIKDRHIVYSQTKKQHQTESILRVPLNSWLEEILARQDKTNKSIFNAIPDHLKGDDMLKKIESVQTTINKLLKLIAQKVGITKHINFKLARTTFADIANKRSNRNIYGIKSAMGHTRVQTTEIYLGEDQSAIDELLKQVYN
jgi:integrase